MLMVLLTQGFRTDPCSHGLHVEGVAACGDPHDPPACSLLSLWPPSLQLTIGLSEHAVHTHTYLQSRKAQTRLSVSSAVRFTSPREGADARRSGAFHPLLPLLLRGVKDPSRWTNDSRRDE